MGVSGLCKYISNNSNLFLKPFELCDTFLVVDGANVSCNLYTWCTKGDSVFGGDYDEYHKVVHDFFTSLKKCNVTPIVLFDGGHERKKLKTVKKRADSKLEFLELFNRNYSDKKFFPIFLTIAFVDVMEELKIVTMTCDFEADIEIASVAKALNCPVLSQDSDFFVFDVSYVPFSSLYLDPICVKSSEEKKKKYYMKCSIFDVSNFLNEFKGLDKSHLPLMVALLGNDYVDSDIFKQFFNHVIIPRDRWRSFNQRKIEGVLNWLKKENLESAITGILKHIRNKDAQKVLRVINFTIKSYNKIVFSMFVHKEISKFLDSANNNLSLCKLKELKIGWPSVIDSLFHKCRISYYIMDIIMLGLYFTHIQVGDYESDSTHCASSNLIRAIYAILRPYMKEELKSLNVYVVHKKKYLAVQFSNDFSSVLKDLNMNEILNKSKNSRVQLLYNILYFDTDDIKTVSTFTETWCIFIMSIIYWIKSLDNSVVSFSHVNALLLLAIANQVVQKSVGFYESCSLLSKKYKKLLDEFKDSDVKVTDDTKDFKCMIRNVTKYECLLIQKSLIPLRHTTDDGKGLSYSIATIRLFNTFQSCLYHIMEINALLNYPFPRLIISDFFSGTLLFNLYLKIKKACQSGSDFGEKLLKPAPNIKKIYLHLLDNFNKYSKNEPIQVNKKHKKKRSNKKLVKKPVEFIVCDEDFSSDKDNFMDSDSDNNNYSDNENHFRLLKAHCFQ